MSSRAQSVWYGATGPNGAFLYGNIDNLFTGNELVYHFFNPVKQTVNFLLRNASDPRLDLILLHMHFDGANAVQVHLQHHVRLNGLIVRVLRHSPQFSKE